jgi:hypothetical protein
VYVKFANQQGAEAAHRALNLRWYSGKQVREEREDERERERGGEGEDEGAWEGEREGVAVCTPESSPSSSAPACFHPLPLLQIIVEYQFLHVYASTFGVR